MGYRTPEEQRIDREVADAQLRVSDGERKRGHCLFLPKDARGYRSVARWLELEALRQYPSYRETLEHAQNQRWMAELVNLHGLEKAKEIGGEYFRKRCGSPRRRGSD
jgi:hypothetical protein